jgi:hypothetical protein
VDKYENPPITTVKSFIVQALVVYLDIKKNLFIFFTDAAENKLERLPSRGPFRRYLMVGSWLYQQILVWAEKE